MLRRSLWPPLHAQTTLATLKVRAVSPVSRRRANASDRQDPGNAWGHRSSSDKLRSATILGDRRPRRGRTATRCCGVTNQRHSATLYPKLPRSDRRRRRSRSSTRTRVLSSTGAPVKTFRHSSPTEGATGQLRLRVVGKRQRQHLFAALLASRPPQDEPSVHGERPGDHRPLAGRAVSNSGDRRLGAHQAASCARWRHRRDLARRSSMCRP